MRLLLLACFTLCATLCPSSVEESPTYAISRPAGAYGGTWLTPNDIRLPNELHLVGAVNYVTVRGWAVYDSNPADGDYHFSLFDEEDVEPGHVITRNEREEKGLTCEIKPGVHLDGMEDLVKVNKDKPSTYRYVEVKGQLRFGTEGSGHDAVRDYFHNGVKIRGHWEIHPVDTVVSLDTGAQIQAGSTAKYDDPAGGEFSPLSWTNWKKTTPNNHGLLKAKVVTVTPATDGSGDYNLSLQEITTASPKKTAKAVVPAYYVTSFDAATKTLTFAPGICNIGGTKLKPGDKKKFLGLRSWHFPESAPYQPVMRPVMKITAP